ncbi:tRNA-His guanylyltransferase [Lecanora helva]
MANSKYEYVKAFEQHTSLLPKTYIVVRVDGRGFHKLSAKYGFEKPNDIRALNLMNAAATAVFAETPEIKFAYGSSDEFRLRAQVAGTSDLPLTPPMPSFDGRVVLYPSSANLRDYMSWRQADCHINNLYNTTFWALIHQGGLDAKQAEEKLKGTVASDKHEVLFSNYRINYNNEPEMFKKGSMIYRDHDTASLKHKIEGAAIGVSDDWNSEMSKNQRDKQRKRQSKAKIVVEHLDIIKDDFWRQRPWLIPEG